ncbi:MAG: hypothetical protein EOO38_16160 [Cytophagaceae bacterium]|nr:MAG: hypothetical protein EOO38_16160 [Cytophagaceae bacterium]
MASRLIESLQHAAGRNQELLAILSQTDSAPAALKQNSIYITGLENDIANTDREIKRLHRITEDERKDHIKYEESTFTRYMYKLRGKRGEAKFAAKAGKEEQEFVEAWQKERETLQSLNLEDGLSFLLERHLTRIAAIHSSWLEAGEPVYRYEELLQNEAMLTELFLDKLQLPASPETLRRALDRCGFESVFKRKLGEVDDASHGRKGLPGDWANHFTPALRRRFHEQFGPLLISAGYERNEQWVG